MSGSQQTDPSPDLKYHNDGRILLALDGGGIRGLSSLLILDEIMQRIQKQEGLSTIPKPCEYFDLIGGTGTGGIIAILLGRLCLSVEEAIAVYALFAKNVFSGTKPFWNDGRFKASGLEAAIQQVVSNYDQSKDKNALMMDAGSASRVCKVYGLYYLLAFEFSTHFSFVCAMPALNASLPRLFRSYPVQANSGYNAKIWEAVRATSAAPTFFKRIFLGPEPKEEFVDGGLRVNNPVYEVLREAKSIWGDDCQIKGIINIGTGHPKTIRVEKPVGIQKVFPTKLVRTLVQIATDCEKTAEDFERDYPDKQVYYRLNVQHGLEEVGLDEWMKLGEVKTHTMQYIRKVEAGAKVDSVTDLLRTSYLSILR
ncbi:hypothetical protein H0H92_004161 [Tricholoma furcatifolium]|nr:hypothetical protein H0H92_004161 [Tricholoma furcatifolium]